MIYYVGNVQFFAQSDVLTFLKLIPVAMLTQDDHDHQEHLRRGSGGKSGSKSGGASGGTSGGGSNRPHKKARTAVKEEVKKKTAATKKRKKKMSLDELAFATWIDVNQDTLAPMYTHDPNSPPFPTAATAAAAAIHLYFAVDPETQQPVEPHLYGFCTNTLLPFRMFWSPNFTTRQPIVSTGDAKHGTCGQV
jgi:hypothetical protein